MKKIILSTILGLAAITADAQFLFRISGSGLAEPSYLLGTIHPLSASLLDSIPEYQEAEAQCQQMYIEYLPPENTLRQAIGSSSRPKQKEQTAKYPDGKNIFDVIDKESAEILKVKFKEILPINLDDPTWKEMWNWTPSVFQDFLLDPIIREYIKKIQKNIPMDFQLMQKAKARGWQVRGLDGENLLVQDIFGALKQTPQTIEEQADSLMALLKNYDERKRQLMEGAEGKDGSLDKICNYWMTGDYEGFATFYLPETNQPILKDRNEKWFPKILTAMREKPTMFVFGSGHLVGEEGIIAKLREAGYKVEHIKNKN
jgi:hypothetical protein